VTACGCDSFTVDTGAAHMTGAADASSHRAPDRKDNVEQAMLECLDREVERVHAEAGDAILVSAAS